MAPGPTNLGGNRFALLDDIPPQKKRKNKSSLNNSVEIFPNLPLTNTHTEDPKFVVVAATSNDKSLSEYSCFAIHKSLKIISKEILAINELRDGNLLLLVKNEVIAKKFVNCKQLPGVCSITCKLHENLNNLKGTIYTPFFNNLPESEIVKELKEYGVIDAFKFTKVIEGLKKPSGAILITFDRYNLPSSIDVAWRKVEVRPYFPNPMRCKTCQLLGHTAKYCKRSPNCVNCNLPPHTPNECSRFLCANCYGQHGANSNSCPKYMQAKEILKIKTINKCSLRDATKKYKQQNPIQIDPLFSYAAITSKQHTVSHENDKAPPTKTNNTNTNNSTETITDYSKSSTNDIKISNNNTANKLSTTKTNSFTDNLSIATNIPNFNNNNNTHDQNYNQHKNTPNLNNNNNTHDQNINNNQHKNDIEMTSLAHSSNSVHNTQNNANFIPLNSLNTVLSKSQLALNHLSDSE